MQRSWAVGAVLAIMLAGCMDDDDFIANAEAQARAHCAAEGKEFVLNKRPDLADGDFDAHDVELDGQCVGPGDPGYLPPKK
jgi:hypothetical protein